MAMQNLQTVNQNKLTLNQYLKAPTTQAWIEEVIKDKKTRDNFITSITSALALTPDLKDCTPKSLLTSALNGFSLGLSPSPMMGQFYMLPFGNSTQGVKNAQFVIGYKGYIQLAMRSGQYKNIIISEIKEGELIQYDPINEEYGFKAIQDPQERAKAKTIGYYAKSVLINGFTKSLYWTKELMEMHAIEFSKGYKAKKGYTFWEKNFDEMAKKTMIRQLISKWGVMSIEMQQAYEHDMEVVDENGERSFADNPNVDYVGAIDMEETTPNGTQESVVSKNNETVAQPSLL